MIRNSAGATYPYIAGPLSITGNSFSTVYYYWFYNWNISTGCESARIPVTATVLSPPKISAPRELGFCLPGAVSTQVDSASMYNNYAWSPMTGISPSGNNVNFNPSATTVYTVTATQTSGLNCVNTAQVVVKAHANPVPSITSADTIFCQSNSPAEISVLSATNRTANNWTTFLYQSFETGLNGWSISNEVGRELSSSWMVRKTPATVGTQTFNFDRDSCIVALNDSSTSLTSTYLNTPSISTIGFDSLRMSSRLIYDYATGDSLDIQASTNGGVDWVNIAGTWINFDVSLGAPAGAIVGFNLPAMFLNQADLQLRMRSKSNNGFVVGIDNIAVEGKRHASFNWTSNIGGYTSNREDSVQVRPTTDAYYYVQMIDSSSGCQGRDTALVRKGLVDLTKILNGGTSGATDSLEATCNDESTGWTYYSGTGSLSSSNFFFAINWDTNYTARTLAKVKIGTSSNYILDTSDPSGTLMRGTWVMKKYWNVDLNGASLGTPVKVRFYFDPSDSATISNAAETYVNQYLNVPMRPWMEPFTWFKTVTGAYVPGANIDSSGVEMFNNVALNVESYGNENGAHYVQFSNVTSFSGGSGSSGAGIGTPLPVELLYFKAKALESGNFLYWATASEKNNSHFEIESSIDGEHFKYIGRIEGAGNSAELKTYDFTDLQPNSNRTYYRLKQVDFDGMFEYSKIQVVTRDGKISFDALVYPIPARDNITIDIISSDKGNANIIITDIAGKIIRTQSVITSLGNTQMKLNIGELNAGNYIVTIDNGSERVNRKFVKVN
ncbi:MAG: T9SS type A sorting domain-containing protein [Bacteroidetes bacterium]|nr:T9SS type A sorting domain-containing protein [Bacteroidota bacterium]